MQIEWKPVISLDTIIAALVMLGALLSVYIGMTTRLTALETKVELMAPFVWKGGR